ncbi:MAG: aminotransferase class V-fold PLP-dependent enzyme [Candidatus Limnocylindria bacterium]
MPSELARHWTLEPGVRFLNHGSFGATPRPVLAAQLAWRERMEREPVAFFARDLEPALDEARAALAGFVGADPADVAFVPNATTGISTVVGSLRLEPGDELLTTDHEYNAAKNALEATASRTGARVVIAPIPFPGTDHEGVVDAVLAAVTSRTRLLLIDHVTSATALIFPVERLVVELAERGIDTLVDGAHAPGMLDLRIAELRATYYTGNCHKWLSAPKGSAFLYVSADRRASIQPLVTSHGANSPRTDRSRFHLEFDWTGTYDPSVYLAIPDAIRFGDGLLPGGWPGLRERNRSLALAARDLLCEALEQPPPVPDVMVGCMASVPLPPEPGPGSVQGIDLYGDPLHDALLERGIQVMTTPWPQRPQGVHRRRLIRVSAAPYNDLDDMRVLADALAEIMAASVA